MSSRLKTLLGDRLGELAAPTRGVLLYAASSPRPTVDLLTAAAGGSIDPELAEAEKLGLVDVSAGRLRFSHPLLRRFVYAEATSAARRDAHARLAAAVDEPVEKARHRALATRDSDGDLAAALDEAATVAGGHRAPPRPRRCGGSLPTAPRPKTRYGGPAGWSGRPATRRQPATCRSRRSWPGWRSRPGPIRRPRCRATGTGGDAALG